MSGGGRGDAPTLGARPPGRTAPSLTGKGAALSTEPGSWGPPCSPSRWRGLAVFPALPPLGVRGPWGGGCRSPRVKVGVRAWDTGGTRHPSGSVNDLIYLKLKLEENFVSLLSGYIVSSAFVLFHPQQNKYRGKREISLPPAVLPRGTGEPLTARALRAPRASRGTGPRQSCGLGLCPPLNPSFSPQMFPLPVANGKSRPTSLAGAQFGSSGRTPLAAWGLLVCLRRSLLA